jgi:tetratricopeptide (TPR) repeat protein
VVERCLLETGKLDILRGDFNQAISRLEQARFGYSEMGDQTGVMEALVEIGRTYLRKDEYPASRRYTEEGLALASALDNRPVKSKALKTLGNLALASHDPVDLAKAQTYYQECLAIEQELGDRVGVASAVNNLGNVAYYQGDLDSAKHLYNESLVISKEIGHRWGVATALTNLGIVSIEQGDYTAARAALEQSLTLRREQGDKPGITGTVNNLGDLAFSQGDIISARKYYEEGRDLSREVGTRREHANALFGLGLVGWAEGDLPGAKRLLIESLGWCEPEGSRREIINNLIGLTRIAISSGELERAAQLVGSIQGMLQLGIQVERVPRQVYEQAVEDLKAALSEDFFNTARTEGAKMTIAEAIALAKGDPGKQSSSAPQFPSLVL